MLALFFGHRRSKVKINRALMQRGPQRRGPLRANLRSGMKLGSDRRNVANHGEIARRKFHQRLPRQFCRWKSWRADTDESFFVGDHHCQRSFSRRQFQSARIQHRPLGLCNPLTRQRKIFSANFNCLPPFLTEP